LSRWSEDPALVIGFCEVQHYLLEFISWLARIIFVLLIMTNQSKQLLRISYVGHVQHQDFQDNFADLTARLAELSPGFRLLTDLDRLESIHADCLPDIGHIMDLIGQAGVGSVVRIIPDPTKDMGLNILSIFHFPAELSIVTCNSTVEAFQKLGL
jgi:hypothetical protein